MSRKVDLNVTFVYIINNDLKMSKGKIASQVSHVAMMLADRNKGILGRAIILRGNQQLIDELIQFFPDEVEHIKDAGLTQVTKNSITCVGWIETKRNEALREITKILKLL